MKRILTLTAFFLFFLFAVAAWGQTMVAAYISPSAGVWNPWTAAASFGAISTVPPMQVQLYCQASSGAQWAPCVPGGGAASSIVVGTTTVTGGTTTYLLNDNAGVLGNVPLGASGGAEIFGQVNGAPVPADDNLAAFNLAGQAYDAVQGTLAQLNIAGVTDPGTAPTSSGATSGGTVGVSLYNKALCQVYIYSSDSVATMWHSDITPISSPVVTTSGNQTIPWGCPIALPSVSNGFRAYTLFGFCQGVSCTPTTASYNATGSTITQNTAASADIPYSWGSYVGNTTGTTLQGPATLNGGAICSAGTACALGAGSTAPTQSPADNSTKVATTAYVDAYGYAPLASPTFSGTVTGPDGGTWSSTGLTSNTSGTAANLSGTPALPNGTTATTQAAGDSSTQLATTAFVISQGTISAGPGLFGSSAINTVIAGTKASQAGHFTNLQVIASLGGTCTTPPQFNVFDGTTNTGTAVTATSTTQTKGNATVQAQTRTFAAGDQIGIYISTAGATCTTDSFVVTAQYSTP